MNLAITYSIYGDKDIYNRGAIANSIQAKEIYPGCDVLMFYDDTVSEETVRILKKNDCRCIDMSVRKWRPESAKMLWRWLPADPCLGYEYERIIVRDCDSRLTLREKWAVDKWTTEGQKLMTIHDSISHVGIMGGLSGVRAVFPGLSQHICDWVMMPDNNTWGLGIDQSFLNAVLKPLSSGSVLIIKGDTIPVPYVGCVPGHCGCLDVPI